MVDEKRATRRKFLVSGATAVGVLTLGALAEPKIASAISSLQKPPEPPGSWGPDLISYSTDLRSVARSWYIGRTFTFENYYQTRLYTVADDKLIQVLPLPSSFPLYGVFTFWSPDNTRIAIAMDQETQVLQIWDVKSGVSAASLSGEKNLWIIAAAWSPDGHRLLVGGGQRIIVLDTSTGKRLFETDVQATLFDDIPGSPVFTWSPDGQSFALLTWSMTQKASSTSPVADNWAIEIWDSRSYTRTNRLTLTAQHPGGVGQVSFLWSPRGDRLALSLGKAIWVFSPSHRGEIPVFIKPSNNLTTGQALVWSPSGTRLAQLAPLNIWDVDTKRRLPAPFTDPSDANLLWSDPLVWDTDGKHIRTVDYTWTLQ